MVAMIGGAVRRVVRPAARDSPNTRSRRSACRARRTGAPGWPSCPSSRSAALTITRSPSMIGDIVRPPCVVNAANSSPIERSQSSLPSLLSARTVAPTPKRVDVPGFRIDGRRRPADAVSRHVALEDVELVLPDHLAGVRVERHHALLELVVPPGGVLDVDAVAHDDRRRPAAVGRAPQEVLAVHRPLVGQAGLGRRAVAVRPAHFRPVAQRHAARTLRPHRDAETQDHRRQKP